jgi:hypothetical protein
MWKVRAIRNVDAQSQNGSVATDCHTFLFGVSLINGGRDVSDDPEEDIESDEVAAR